MITLLHCIAVCGVVVIVAFPVFMHMNLRVLTKMLDVLAEHNRELQELRRFENDMWHAFYKDSPRK